MVYLRGCDWRLAESYWTTREAAHAQRNLTSISPREPPRFLPMREMNVQYGSRKVKNYHDATIRFIRQVVLLSATVLVLTATAGCDRGVLEPAGPVGQAERVILTDATAIMLAVIVPVIILTLVFAWWFRAGNQRATYRPTWAYSGRIELV